MTTRIPKAFNELPVSSLRWLGKNVNRVEDRSLVTGRVEFIDNVVLPEMLHCAILRSPYPHARIQGVDTKAAEALSGVVAVLTGEDVLRWSNPSGSFPEGWGMYTLATDKVRYVGEPVAAVAATDRYIAEDALELISIDYEPLDAVADGRVAARGEGALIYEDRENNVVLDRKFKWGDVERAFTEADHVFRESFRWNRVGGNPMETFGVISQWDPIEESLTCRASIQSARLTGLGLAAVLGIPSNKVLLVTQPHGGSFGGKGNPRGAAMSALLSRKAGGRPVKWIEDRMEYLLGGWSQAWDRHYEVELAVRSDGKFTGLRVKLIEDIGASAENFGAVAAGKPLSCFTGCYTIPVAEYELSIVVTNKLPTAAYRGMGPPPHNLVLEQMVDIAARDLGMDPAEIRRKNYIAPEQFPYTIPSGNEYDSGEYEATLNKALEMADYQELRKEQARAREEGRYLGIGVANAIEPGVFDWNAYAIVGVPNVGVPEGVSVGIDELGKIIVRVGFSLEGQGQYTLASQLLADYFGVGMEDVRVICLDSQGAAPHFGPGGSRLGVSMTGAILGASGKLREKLVRIAAHIFRVDEAHVNFSDGVLCVNGVPDGRLGLADVAGIAHARSDLLPPGMEPGLEASYLWTAPGRAPIDEQGRAKSYLTAANACHVVLVELDVETGKVEILKYWIADDCGTRLNPATVEGMTQGGVAQGVGAALLEEYVYDEGAQPLVSTFMDYLVPTIHEVPMTEKEALETPSPFSPLGAKGCGEGAIHTTPAAVLCAVNDALVPLGVMMREVPASPNRIWKLVKDAKK